MRYHKKWKQLLALGLGLTLALGQAAYAEVTIDPHPQQAETGGDSQLPSPDELLAGVTGTGLPSAVIVAGTHQSSGAGGPAAATASPGASAAETNPAAAGGSAVIVGGSGGTSGGSGTAAAGGGTSSSGGSSTVVAGSGIPSSGGSGTIVAGSGSTSGGSGTVVAGSGTPSAGSSGPVASGNGTVAAGNGPTANGSTDTGTSSAAAAQASLTAPTIAAEGAVLMDASTGQVLYGKNEDQQFYPASITKVMTALLVLERCNLNDVVTFSASATTNLESGAVSLGIAEGDQLTVEQCLYGLLLKSANEIGNGLAEHVAGSVSGFADLMNAKARELGCKNTNFVNPHGLNDANHKTTPYDMALIMRAALQNDTFRKIDTTRTYDFPATKNAAARTITMGHKMMYPSDSRYYEGIIGGKTGYTSKAGNTLVTGAERNGVRLVVVIMKASGTHYTDTKALLDYGFENYAALTGR